MGRKPTSQQSPTPAWAQFAEDIRSRPQAPRGMISGEDITSLGALEAEVLGILWEIGVPATSMDVMETSLYKRRAQGQEPASFATIATTLRRLTEKGLLTTEKGQARTPYYSPTVEREEMAARILNRVSETLLGQTFYRLLPRLAGGQSDVAGSADDQQTNIKKLLQSLKATSERTP